MHKFGDTPLLYYDWMQNCDHGVLARIFYLPETYERLFSHSLDNRTISEPFLLDKDVMKNAYRNWNSAVKVIISDPPRKDFHPARRPQNIPDSLVIPPADDPFDEYFD